MNYNGNAGYPGSLVESIGMENALDKPSETTEDLQVQVVKLQSQVDELAAKVKWYEEQFRLSQQKKFGASSERTHPDQLQLFNEAEAEANPAQGLQWSSRRLHQRWRRPTFA